jgi:peptidoglycan hydrolase FlgJ
VTVAPASPIAPTGGISTDESRTASRANLDAAGKKFESVFTGMMLKSMRQAKLADGLFDSKAEDTFTEMQDTKLANAMAEHTPLGIGKAMVDFLAKNQSALAQPGTPAAATDDGAAK